MATLTLQLISNANQAQQGLVKVVLPNTGVFTTLSEKAKSKLKLKRKPTTCYLEGGTIISSTTLDSDIIALFQSIQDESNTKPIKLYFSDGEVYAGPPPSSKTATDVKGKYRVIASEALVDEEAYKQLKDTLKLEGMLLAIGMPDLHPGNRFPIGATFISDRHIYPSLIGGDIGCGMALHQLPIPVGDPSQAANIAKRLVGIEGPYPFHTTQHQQDFLHSYNVRTDLPGGTEYSVAFDSLGTIGRGNHFAEFLKIAEIRDQESATSLGLSSSQLLLLVHSGSRDVGQHVLENITRQKEQSLTDGSTSMLRYLEEHDQSLKWAKANRALIAKRVLDALGENMAVGSKEILDVWHNFVEKRTVSAGLWDGEGSKDVWIHRKGAASTFDGAVVIPGSRGARSYIVMPQGDGILNAHSLAHGAGRAMPRTTAKAKFSKPHYANMLHTTVFGSEVICENLNLLYEEAPEAYKDVDNVVKDLEDVGACRVVAVLEPVVTYKCRQN